MGDVLLLDSSVTWVNSLSTNNGTFRIGQGRNFATAGSLTNSGSLFLNTSTLTVNGAFTQTSAGHLNILVTGDAAGQYGRLNATGAANLGGFLDTTVASNYKYLGAALRIINAASRTGTLAIAGATGQYDSTGMSLILQPQGTARSERISSLKSNQLTGESRSPSGSSAYAPATPLHVPPADTRVREDRLRVLRS